VLLLLEPTALGFAAVVAIVLMLSFRRAIWPTQQIELDAQQEGLAPLIDHRLRLVNARQVFSALMPLTVLLLLAASLTMDLFSFDLARLLFTVLISILGSSLGSLLQNLLRLRRQSVFQQKGVAALRWGDRSALESLLSDDAARGEYDDDA